MMPFIVKRLTIHNNKYCFDIVSYLVQYACMNTNTTHTVEIPLHIIHMYICGHVINSHIHMHTYIFSSLC